MSELMADDGPEYTKALTDEERQHQFERERRTITVSIRAGHWDCHRVVETRLEIYPVTADRLIPRSLILAAGPSVTDAILKIAQEAGTLAPDREP